MPQRRLFIALPVEDESAVRPLDKICRSLKKFESSLKIVPPGNYHITVKFFGPVESGIADSIAEKFLSLDGLKKVEYKIEGVGAFPSAVHPSVIWAGLKCDEKPLAEIFRSVEEMESFFGFEPEKRKFVPHLTLARVKREKNLPAELKSFIADGRDMYFSSSVFSELVLYESILKRTGAEYIKLVVIKLA